MKTLAPRLHNNLLSRQTITDSTTISSSFTILKCSAKSPTKGRALTKTCTITKTNNNPVASPQESDKKPQAFENGYSKAVILGAIAVGMGLVLAEQKAAALGPDGPLMEEEFWDNVRRYALYALTVSTGAIYTIAVPILELLKNPISAILILVILAGIFFIVSQVLSAMVGVTDFSYDYGY